MVEHLQGSPEPGRRDQQWAHDWHPYNDYLDVHASYMAALIESGLVIRSGLSIVETRASRQGQELLKVNISGRIWCALRVLIVVNKWLDVRRGRQRRYEVKGYSYSYHAWVRNTSCNLIRYDTAHGIERLHCHRLNTVSGQVEYHEIELCDLPTLSDFIVEALVIAEGLDNVAC